MGKGYHCFFLTIKQILLTCYIPEKVRILDLMLWDYNFTYDFFSFQNRICEKRIENNENEYLESILSNVNYIKQKIENGEPLFVKSNRETYVVVDFDEKGFLLRNGRSQKYMSINEIIASSVFELKMSRYKKDIDLKCELSFIAGRYKILRYVKDKYGVEISILHNTKNDVMKALNHQGIIFFCDSCKLPYSCNWGKNIKRMRYLFCVNNNSNVLLVDKFEDYEEEIDYEYIETYILGNETTVYAVSIEIKEEIEIEKQEVMDFLKTETGILQKKCFLFYERLWGYILNNFLDNKLRQNEVIDNVYIQIADIEYVRSKFYEMLDRTEWNQNELTELFKKLVMLWKEIKFLIIRLSYYQNKFYLEKLKFTIRSICNLELSFLDKIREFINLYE